MSTWSWALIAVIVALVLYAGLILWLCAVGRRQDARALAGFIPDCIVLVHRLVDDKRVPRSRKVLLGALIAYLAMPFDLIPDFIPVAGQLDDAILIAVVIRFVLRSSEELLGDHWPGPERSLMVIRRIAFGR
jgi:uncharacterized membrane protein YkvA (DUF1232 family)